MFASSYLNELMIFLFFLKHTFEILWQPPFSLYFHTDCIMLHVLMVMVIHHVFFSNNVDACTHCVYLFFNLAKLCDIFALIIGDLHSHSRHGMETPRTSKRL